MSMWRATLLRVVSMFLGTIEVSLMERNWITTLASIMVVVIRSILILLVLCAPFSVWANDDIYSYYHDSMESDMVGESVLWKIEFIEKWQVKAREDVKVANPQDRIQIKKFLRVSLSDWKYWRAQVKDWEYRKHFNK